MGNIQAIADEFGMSAERFLHLFNHNRLPGQLPSRVFSEDQDSDIDLSLDLAGIKKSSVWERLERAARFSGETAEEFVSSTIMEAIRATEETMVFSPRTGKPVCSRWDLPG
jgi:hypothetical protein